jgi:hypothetical protein
VPTEMNAWLDEPEIAELVNRGTSGWLHALAPEHCPGRKQPLVARPRAFVVVKEFERPFSQVHECYVGRCAHIERSAIIKRREHARCIHSCASYYLADRHAEHNEFRHNVWEIDNARRLRQDVPIGGQGIGPEALLRRFFHGVPIKVVGDTVAEIKENSASARRGHVCEQVALVVENAVHSGSVHMSDYVSALEQRENRAHRRVILADVDHYGQVERRGSLLGAPQSLKIICAGNVVR